MSVDNIIVSLDNRTVIVYCLCFSLSKCAFMCYVLLILIFFYQQRCKLCCLNTFYFNFHTSNKKIYILKLGFDL